MWLIAAEWPLLTVQRSVASQEDEWQVSASTVIELQNLTGCSQPEAVCESTFRRACTALLTFPAYFRQNASTAFIRRRFSVVT